MDLAKLSTEDLVALKTGDLSKVSTEGLMELKHQQSGGDSIAEQNLRSLDNRGPLDDLKSIAGDIGTDVKAGYAGLADLVSGNGLKKAAENVGHVEKDEDTTSAASTIGSALGAQFTPAQIALQAIGGKIGEAIGPWVADAMKGWASDVAVNAVGKIKSIAKSLGVSNLDALGKFLMSPIQIGGKSFEPIVTAASSPQDMLNAANAIKAAAGKQLGAVSATVDGALSGITDESGMTMNVAPSILNLQTLTKDITALKEEAVGDLPNLGKKVANQFDDAIGDIEAFIKKQETGDTKTMFSDLAEIKTKIGNLVYKHGSPLESKAALNDVYHAISEALDEAAKKVGGASGAAYEQANAVYHQAMAVVEALEGKVVDAKKLFDAPAFLAALSAGMATVGAGHGVLAGITAPLGYAAAKVAENYAPQALARGLDTTAPLVAGAIKLTARGVPVVGNIIAQGLQSHEQ